MATEKLVNDFLMGADPECVLLNPPHLVNGQTRLNRIRDPLGLFGFDHGGYVLEPHPTPSRSVRVICSNLRKSLDYISFLFQDHKIRAGAYVQAPEREISLGGHVHLDRPKLKPDQVSAMDVFATSLENLEILPKVECRRRHERGGYGNMSDVRYERGRCEYRSMCSWLFNAKTTMLCMTGIKLAFASPELLTKPLTSLKKLVSWVENFKEEDDDARWMLEKGYFDSNLTADPDASLVNVWKVDAERGKAIADAFAAKEVTKMLVKARAQANQQEWLTLVQQNYGQIPGEG